MRIPLLLLSVSAALAAAPKPRTELLVTTQWLAKHLEDPNVAVLHVGRERAQYDAGHIPGARFIALGEIAVERGGVPSELAPIEKLREIFETAGVSDDTRVVLYGEMIGLAAARALYTLDYMGHNGGVLLDGGIEKWRAEKRPVSTEVPKPRRGRLTPAPRPAIVVPIAAMRDLAWTASKFPDAPIAIVDARRDAEYKTGHIPGAKDVNWMDNLLSKEMPVLKPVPALRKMYAAAGVKPDAMAVTYCAVGMRASYAWFVLRYLGYDARIYDGSMAEWSHAPDAPIER